MVDWSHLDSPQEESISPLTLHRNFDRRQQLNPTTPLLLAEHEGTLAPKRLASSAHRGVRKELGKFWKRLGLERLEFGRRGFL